MFLRAGSGWLLGPGFGGATGFAREIANGRLVMMAIRHVPAQAPVGFWDPVLGATGFAVRSRTAAWS
jgi:hypothetical protein